MLALFFANFEAKTARITQAVKKKHEAKLVARLPATAVLWVRIQTSPKNTKWAT